MPYETLNPNAVNGITAVTPNNATTTVGATTQSKIDNLQTKVQEKTNILAGEWKPAMLESFGDSDSPTIVGVTGGKGTVVDPLTGKVADLTGKLTEDRSSMFDAYEVGHPGDPYRNTKSGIAKYERQRQRLTSDIVKVPGLADKLGVKDINNITDDDIVRAGTREQLLSIYNAIPGEKQAWEPGPLDYWTADKPALEAGSKDNPLNIPVERRFTGKYDAFGRPLADIRNIDTKQTISEALGYNGTEDKDYSAAKAIESLKAQGKLTPELEQYINKSAKYVTNPKPQAMTLEEKNAAFDALMAESRANDGIGEELASIPGAVAYGLTKGAMNTADFVTDIAQRGVNQIAGTDFKGGAFDDKTIKEVAGAVGSKLGFEASQDEASQKKAQAQWDVAFKGVDILKPSTYGNVLDMESAKAAGNALAEYWNNPSMAGSSLGEMGVGFGAGKVATGIGSKLVQKYGDDVTKASLKASDEAYKSIDNIKASALPTEVKAAKIAEEEAKITTAGAIANRVEDALPAVTYSMGITNQQMTDYKTNNGGQEMSTERMLGSLVANTLAFAVPDMATAKIALGANKTVNEGIQNTVKSAVGKALTRVAVGAGVEIPQEAVEGIVETVNTRLGTTKYKDQTLGEIVSGATSEILGQSLGGGVGGAHMAIPHALGALGKDILAGPSRDEVVQNMADEVKTANETAVKNMTENLDMAGTKELTEDDTKLEETLGVDSISRLYSNAESVPELRQDMFDTKFKILDDVYEYTADKYGVPQITSVKDVSKLDAVDNWMKEYANYQKDADGVVPKAIQDEVDRILDINAKARAEQAGKVGTLEEKVARAASVGIDVTGKNEEDIKAEVHTAVDNMLKTYGLDQTPEYESLKTNVTKKVLDTYGISGMNIGPGVKIELDREALADMVRAEAGLKTGGIDQRVTNVQGKAIPIRTVSNTELNEIMSGEGVSGTTETAANDNTKMRERVVSKLDPLTANNVTKTLEDVNEKINATIERKLDEAGKYFKGDVAGNMKRGMILGMNTINGATASDTELRRNTELNDSMLQADQYYAGYSSTIEQIGKDYASSYGLKLTGDKVQMAKAHRDIGRFILGALEDAGLVEVTKDNIWTRVGDTTTAENTKLAGAKTKVGVRTQKAVDKNTDEQVLLAQDRGIRLVDTGAMFDVNDASGEINKYESKIGDAVKRVARLLLPGNERVPNTEYVEKPIKVAEGISIDETTQDALQRFMARPLKMKTGVVQDLLRYLKGVNETQDGGLNSSRSKELRGFLGIKESGSELLEDSDKGSTMGKLDNIIGILDNLDELSNEDGVYYTVQVDINNRLTVVETVANYQGDKVFARNIMGPGEYTVESEAEKKVLLASLRDEIANEDDKNLSDEELIAKYAKLYEQITDMANGDYGKLINIVHNNTEKGYALEHLGKAGGFKILSLLEGAKDVRDGLASGKITTQYVPEKDASASGVFNTLMNISGRNPEVLKGILGRLGVEFDGTKALERTDAYSLLKDIIDKLMAQVEGIDTKVAGEVNRDGLEAIKKMNDALGDKKLLRNLAKYPIMTWFYSAEEKSIVRNLTTEVTKSLISKALEGDQKVIDYLSGIVGKDMTVAKIRAMKKGSKEHKAIKEELDKVGKVYYSQLTEAFPEVGNFKKEMKEYFNFLKDNTTVDGKDYWQGKVRTALGALHGTNETMSLYKWKNTALDMSAQEKIDKGLTIEDESLDLITVMDQMPNETSMMPLMAHSIDAAQAVKGLDGVSEHETGIMSVHDGFYTTPKALLDFQASAEKATKEIAVAYDMVNEMAIAMRESAKDMRVKAKLKANEGIKDKLEKAASKLETKAEEIEVKNRPRMEAKVEVLKNAKTTLFGEEGYTDGTSTEVKRAPVKAVEEVKKEAVQSVAKNMYDALEELVGLDVRAADVLAETEGITLVTLNTETTKELLASIGAMAVRNSIRQAIKDGKTFTYKGKVYIGKDLLEGKDELTGEKATAGQIVDTVLHEIEHAVTDEYIRDNKGSVEYRKLAEILDKVIKGEVPSGLDRRVADRVNYIKTWYTNNPEQGIKELVAVSREEEVAVEVFKALNKMAGIQGNIVERLIKQLWDKIQQMLNKTPVEELLDKTDVYSLAIAVKSIQNKARETSAVANENVDTISGYFTEINDIC